MAKRYGSHWAAPTFPGWWLQLQLRTSLTRFGSEYCRLCAAVSKKHLRPTPLVHRFSWRELEYACEAQAQDEETTGPKNKLLMSIYS